MNNIFLSISPELQKEIRIDVIDVKPKNPPAKPTANPPAKPLAYSSTNPYANQPAYPSASQPAYPSAIQPAYPSANQPAYPSAYQPTYPSASQPTYPSASQPTYPSASQPVYPSASQPANLTNSSANPTPINTYLDDNIVSKKKIYIRKYNNPIKYDIDGEYASTLDISEKILSDNILKNFKYDNIKDQTISTNELEFIFDSKLNTINNNFLNNNKYLNKGSKSVVYSIILKKTNNFNRYINQNMVLKIFTTNNDNLIASYNSDILNLPEIKNNMVDILYYGSIVINKIIFYYIITPIYNTKFWELKFPDTLLLAKNIIKTLKYIYDNKYFYNDLSSINIGYDNKLNMIIIDYDNETFTKELNLSNSFIPKYLTNSNNEFIHAQTIINYNKDPKSLIPNMDTLPILNKFYSIGLGEIFYHLFFINMEAKPFFPTFCNSYKTKIIKGGSKSYNEQFIIMYDFSDDVLKEYNRLIDNCVINNINDLLYNNNKGLFSNIYDNIPSLDDIIILLDKLELKIIQSYKLTDSAKQKIIKYNIPSSNLILKEYGYMQKNYMNENLYQFKFFAPYNLEKLRVIEYYLTYNRWSIIEYDNDNDPRITNNTLKYALQVAGCIHSVEFDDKGPIFKVHINKDFRDKYGFYFDNCRIMENNILTLIWWCINITDMFNLLFLKNSPELISHGPIYINIVDHPIVREDNAHPFVEFRTGSKEILIPITVKPDKPIYCWPSKKKYNDIGLPYHDIWMFLFEREFSDKFNISTYINFYNDKISLDNDYKTKINKGLFRGSFTNCVDDDLLLSSTPRIRAHIKTLQNNEEYIDAYIVKSNFNYINYTQGQIKSENIEYFGSIEKFMIPSKQIRYKALLNLDGFASPFRTIQEMYYNSCIIVPESDFTDVLRDCLIPWKHYVPCKKDLSNIINTIKWCTENDDKVLNILKNLRELRDNIISLDNMVNLSINLILNPSKDFNLVKLVKFNVDNQLEYKPDTMIPDDIIIKKGIKGKLEFNREIKTLEEDVYYEKYLKYKNKYLRIKNIKQ